MQGKVGVVVGVANHRSLAWAIARAAAAEGAQLVPTYPGRVEEHVRELAATLAPEPVVLPCDVQHDADIDAVFAQMGERFGGLDFVVHGAAFAPREARPGGSSRPRAGFRRRSTSAPTRSSPWLAVPSRCSRRGGGAAC